MASDDQAKILEDAKKLPFADRVAHKSWFVRAAAYEDIGAACKKALDPEDPIFSEVGNLPPSWFKATQPVNFLSQGQDSGGRVVLDSHICRCFALQVHCWRRASGMQTPMGWTKPWRHSCSFLRIPARLRPAGSNTQGLHSYADSQILKLVQAVLQM